MRCLAFRHLAHEGLGLFRPALRERSWDFEERDLRSPVDVPETAGGPEIDLLIVLGGPMSVYQFESTSHLQRETEVVRRRLQEGLPTLGLCLGAQMMAAALGAPVYAGPRPEVGWHRVDLEEEGARDPIFASLLSPSSMALHWHNDTFDLPGDAIALARSDLYKSQAFRYELHSYAVQFHAEVPPADLPEWIKKSHIPLNRPPHTPAPEEILLGGRRWGEACREQAHFFMTDYLRSLEARRRAH
jgi:GMP synthase (glutamine-hydrolysing)